MCQNHDIYFILFIVFLCLLFLFLLSFLLFMFDFLLYFNCSLYSYCLGVDLQELDDFIFNLSNLT
jgi:hypothetical protein